MAITSSNGFQIIKKALSGIYELSDDSIKTKIIIERDGVLFFEYLKNNGTKAKHIDNQKLIFNALSDIIEMPSQSTSISITLEKDRAAMIQASGYAQFKD